MSEQQLLDLVKQVIDRIAASKGTTAPKILPNTALLGGGLPIDSLDLAALVVELEQATGHDPFKQGFVDFRTAGELVQLYRQ
jgi:acyl carrier protein